MVKTSKRSKVSPKRSSRKTKGRIVKKIKKVASPRPRIVYRSAPVAPAQAHADLDKKIEDLFQKYSQKSVEPSPSPIAADLDKKLAQLQKQLHDMSPAKQAAHKREEEARKKAAEDAKKQKAANAARRAAEAKYNARVGNRSVFDIDTTDLFSDDSALLKASKSSSGEDLAFYYDDDTSVHVIPLNKCIKGKVPANKKRYQSYADCVKDHPSAKPVKQQANKQSKQVKNDWMYYEVGDSEKCDQMAVAPSGKTGHKTKWACEKAASDVSFLRGAPSPSSASSASSAPNFDFLTSSASSAPVAKAKEDSPFADILGLGFAGRRGAKRSSPKRSRRAAKRSGSPKRSGSAKRSRRAAKRSGSPKRSRRAAKRSGSPKRSRRAAKRSGARKSRRAAKRSGARRSARRAAARRAARVSRRAAKRSGSPKRSRRVSRRHARK